MVKTKPAPNNKTAQKREKKEGEEKFSTLRITSRDIAENLARVILGQELTPSSIVAIKGIAESEGIAGVTRETAALTKELLKREYKRRADEVEEEERKPTIAEYIVSMVEDSDVFLFTDNYRDAFAQIPREGHVEILRIQSQEYKEYLIYQYRGMTGRVPNANSLRDAINTISASATHDGPRYRLYNRVAVHDGAIWYDMSNDKWEVIRIDENGWEILPSTPIPLFQRFDHQTSQVTPVKTHYGRRAARHRRAKILKLIRFHNLADEENRLLDIASLVFELVPDVPHPLTMPYGPAGSGKTLGFHKTRKLLIDPSVIDQGLPWPKKDRDVPIQFERHYILIYSNLSWLTWEMSDHLCRVIDGAADETRALYKDREMITFKYTRVVGLNAIPIIITREDLLDRSLLFKLDAIAAEKRMDEEELNKAFEIVRPVIFGAILDTLSAAMRIRPNIKLGYIERMGAFTKWGCSIAEALGYEHKEFLDAYGANRKTANREFIEADMLARVTVEFMEETLSWSGTPRSLYDALVEFKWGNKELPKSWPKDEIEMSKRYTRIKQPLYQFGLDFKRGRKTRRDITLAWRDNYGPRDVQEVFPIEEKPDDEEDSDKDMASGLNVTEMIKDTPIYLDKVLQSGLSVPLSVRLKEEKINIKKEVLSLREGPTDSPDCRDSSKNISDSLDKEGKTPSLNDKSRPKKPKRKPLLRIVKNFSDWLSRLPSAGQRGFLEEEVRKVCGDNYLERMTRWIDRGWIEQKGKTLMWWISDEGRTALAGGYIGVEGGD